MKKIQGLTLPRGTAVDRRRRAGSHRSQSAAARAGQSFNLLLARDGVMAMTDGAMNDDRASGGSESPSRVDQGPRAELCQPHSAVTE
jgi:hypothetical protein